MLHARRTRLVPSPRSTVAAAEEDDRIVEVAPFATIPAAPLATITSTLVD